MVMAPSGHTQEQMPQPVPNPQEALPLRAITLATNVFFSYLGGDFGPPVGNLSEVARECIASDSLRRDRQSTIQQSGHRWPKIDHWGTPDPEPPSLEPDWAARTWCPQAQERYLYPGRKTGTLPFDWSMDVKSYIRPPEHHAASFVAAAQKIEPDPVESVLLLSFVVKEHHSLLRRDGSSFPPRGASSVWPPLPHRHR